MSKQPRLNWTGCTPRPTTDAHPPHIAGSRTVRGVTLSGTSERVIGRSDARDNHGSEQLEPSSTSGEPAPWRLRLSGARLGPQSGVLTDANPAVRVELSRSSVARRRVELP
jgi:hypothetical protein